jgi:hypothetical protein
MTSDFMTSDSHSSHPFRLTRFPCKPPLPFMRLILRLPSHIGLYATCPTGVDLGDIFQAIWKYLQMLIPAS